MQIRWLARAFPAIGHGPGQATQEISTRTLVGRRIVSAGVIAELMDNTFTGLDVVTRLPRGGLVASRERLVGYGRCICPIYNSPQRLMRWDLFNRLSR